MIHFTPFQTFPKIPKNTQIPEKSLKSVKSSNLWTKSLKVTALLEAEILVKKQSSFKLFYITQYYAIYTA